MCSRLLIISWLMLAGASLIHISFVCFAIVSCILTSLQQCLRGWVAVDNVFTTVSSYCTDEWQCWCELWLLDWVVFSVSSAPATVCDLSLFVSVSVEFWPSNSTSRFALSFGWLSDELMTHCEECNSIYSVSCSQQAAKCWITIATGLNEKCWRLVAASHYDECTEDGWTEICAKTLRNILNLKYFVLFCFFD